MARTKTDSFILELKLKTSPADDAYLEKCFSAGCSICNTLAVSYTHLAPSLMYSTK